MENIVELNPELKDLAYFSYLKKIEAKLIQRIIGTKKKCRKVHQPTSIAMNARAVRLCVSRIKRHGIYPLNYTQRNANSPNRAIR
jgi:hypothetical protein